MNSFYSREELSELGLKSYGENVLISRKTSIYGADKIILGNHVRIDDFCVLSGKIEIGNYVHIAAYGGFFAGDAGIVIDDFSTTSSKVAIYAISDDYSGESMTNPLVPEKYRSVEKAEVHIGRHVVIGAESVILPGVVIGEGCSFGAMSLIKKSTEPWGVYADIPCRRIRARSKKLLEYEAEFLKEIQNKR